MKKNIDIHDFRAKLLSEEEQTEEVNEMSVSGGAAPNANFTSGTGEQYASKKSFKKEEKNSKERGTGKGYIYKDLWEGKYFTTKDNRLIADDEASWQKMYGALTNLLHNPELADVRPYIKGWHSSTKQIKFKNSEALQKFKSYLEKFDSESLQENYGRFKNETKTRTKSDQFHQAIREVRKKVQEINKVFEYVNRLKNELNEGDSGLKYKRHTEAAIQKIKEMVNELNSKVKKFK
jgi:hypothetical protein